MSGRFERTSLTPGLPLGAPSPGASFSDLIETLGLTPRIDMTGANPGAITAPEGTTVLALRYGAGVVR